MIAKEIVQNFFPDFSELQFRFDCGPVSIVEPYYPDTLRDGILEVSCALQTPGEFVMMIYQLPTEMKVAGVALIGALIAGRAFINKRLQKDPEYYLRTLDI